MNRSFALLLLPGLLAAQANQKSHPLYRVTVLERTTQAVNYSHRNVPTRVDLKGTVLAPEARGEARVEVKRGAIEIDAKVERLHAPYKYGPEYLTYVLWAITPDGRPRNLGELILDPGDKARLRVTSELQAFALLVTAEPYFSVTQPSDVVVMENVVRPDTLGKVEQVSVKYELMPRGHYTYVRPPNGQLPPPNGAKLSMDQYEALLSLYQALNAIQIAQAAGADRHAAVTMRRAVELYEQARQLQAGNAGSQRVIMIARQAAQTAEDARAISAKQQP